MYPTDLPLRDNLREAHAQTWQRIAGPGEFFTGTERIEFVRVAREALDCTFCQDRLAALGPNAVTGAHDTSSRLDPAIVDMIHRLRTDPGRLTRAWFDEIIGSGLSKPAYIEILSVVTSSVIVDTLHNALGLGLAELPAPRKGRPRGEYNEQAVEAGAWVPIQDAEDGLDGGVPNIFRSMGLVPSAVAHFFGTFRPHYALRDLPLSISQTQAEFVAARVSALNECFY